MPSSSSSYKKMSSRNSSSKTKQSSPSPSTSPDKQYYLITDGAPTDEELLQQAQDYSSWQEPYVIDDGDLMFDGKPLNMLYEENRWSAEHERGQAAQRDAVVYDQRELHRGRSRKSRK